MLQRTNIYLPVEMINLLKRKSIEERMTMSEIIRDTIKKELEKEKTSWAQSLLEISKKAKGSGLRDLSKRHDYYLYIEPYERRQRQLRERMRKRKRKIK